jgi:hypothetical protein
MTLKNADGDSWMISLDDGETVGTTMREHNGKYSGGTFSGKTPAAALAMFNALARSQKAAGYFDPGKRQKDGGTKRPEKKAPFHEAAWSAWWKKLPGNWKSALKVAAGTKQLQSIAALTEFEAHEAGLKDLKPLERLTGLQSLSLYGNEFSDLRPLVKLKSLRVLEIDNCAEVTDLRPLVSLKNLAELNIAYTSVTDVKVLKKMRRLTELRVAGLENNFDNWKMILRDLKKSLPDCRIATAE